MSLRNTSLKKCIAGTVLCLLFVVPINVSSQTIDVNQIQQLLNEERSSHNLSPLTSNGTLTDAALLKAEDMHEKNYFSHESPDGRMPWDYIDATTYPYEYAGENLAVDYDSPTEVVSAWLESTAHRDNILNSNFNHLGLATTTIDGRTAIVLLLGNAAVTTQPTETVQEPTDDSTLAETSSIIENQRATVEVLSTPIISDNSTVEKRAVAGQFYPGNELQSSRLDQNRIQLPFILITAYTAWLIGIIIATKYDKKSAKETVQK